MNTDITIFIASGVIALIAGADVFVSDSPAAVPLALSRVIAGTVIFIVLDSGVALYEPAAPLAAGIAVLAALGVTVAYLPNILPFVLPATQTTKG